MPTTSKTKGRLVIPRFTSPREEAEWCDKNRKKLEADMSRRLAARDTTKLAVALAQSAAKEKAKLKPVTIRMLPDDLETLRRVAAEKGFAVSDIHQSAVARGATGTSHQ